MRMVLRGTAQQVSILCGILLLECVRYGISCKKKQPRIGGINLILGEDLQRSIKKYLLRIVLRGTAQQVFIISGSKYRLKSELIMLCH